MKKISRLYQFITDLKRFQICPGPGYSSELAKFLYGFFYFLYSYVHTMIRSLLPLSPHPPPFYSHPLASRHMAKFLITRHA
jgi:hypothetical protein